MPSAPLHPCPCSPTCPELLPPGVTRCKAGAVQKEHQRQNFEIRKWYRRAKWAHPVWGVRAQVLRRDAYTCRHCGTATVDVDVDHIEKHNGNEQQFYDMANLQVLCRKCHARKTKRGG